MTIVVYQRQSGADPAYAQLAARLGGEVAFVQVVSDTSSVPSWGLIGNKATSNPTPPQPPLGTMAPRLEVFRIYRLGPLVFRDTGVRRGPLQGEYYIAFGAAVVVQATESSDVHARILQLVEFAGP